MCLSMEVYRQAEELRSSSSSLHIAIVFALVDQNSLDQQHRLKATEFCQSSPGLVE